jgi:hypothetical protein
MATKYVFCYSVNNLSQNSKIKEFLSNWVSKQDQKGWKEHGFYPGTQNVTDYVTFNFYILSHSSLPQDQVNLVLDILKSQGAKFISTHIVPRPA